MYIEPFGITALPHTRFLRLAGARPTLAVYVLRQADVRYAGGVLADQVDVRVEDGGVHGLAVFTQHCGGETCTDLSVKIKRIEVKTNTDTKKQLTVLEVELVKVHALHQVSQRFGLKRGQSRVTDSPVTHTD